MVWLKNYWLPIAALLFCCVIASFAAWAQWDTAQETDAACRTAGFNESLISADFSSKKYCCSNDGRVVPFDEATKSK